MALSKLNYMDCLNKDLNDINTNIFTIRVLTKLLIKKLPNCEEINNLIEIHWRIDRESGFLYLRGDISELNLTENVMSKNDVEKMIRFYLNVISAFEFLTNFDGRKHRQTILTILPYAEDILALVVFCELFKTVIHSSVSISDSDKLLYLRTSLIGSVAKIVSQPYLNYHAAWEILTKHCDEYSSITDKNYAKFIINIPIIDKFSLKNLKQLLEHTQLYIKLGERFNQTSFISHPLFALLIISKFDQITMNEWKLFLDNRQSTLEEAEKFLKLHIEKMQKLKLSNVLMNGCDSNSQSNNSSTADNNNGITSSKLFKGEKCNLPNEKKVLQPKPNPFKGNSATDLSENQNCIHSNSLLNEYLTELSSCLDGICKTLAKYKGSKSFQTCFKQIGKLDLQRKNLQSNSNHYALASYQNDGLRNVFNDNSTPPFLNYHETIPFTKNETVRDETSAIAAKDKDSENQFILNENLEAKAEKKKLLLVPPSVFATNDKDNRYQFGLNETLQLNAGTQILDSYPSRKFNTNKIGNAEEFSLIQGNLSNSRKTNLNLDRNDNEHYMGINETIQSNAEENNLNLGSQRLATNDEVTNTNQLVLNSTLQPHNVSKSLHLGSPSIYDSNDSDNTNHISTQPSKQPDVAKVNLQIDLQTVFVKNDKKKFVSNHNDPNEYIYPNGERSNIQLEYSSGFAVSDEDTNANLFAVNEPLNSNTERNNLLLDPPPGFETNDEYVGTNPLVLNEDVLRNFERENLNLLPPPEFSSNDEDSAANKIELNYTNFSSETYTLQEYSANSKDNDELQSIFVIPSSATSVQQNTQPHTASCLKRSGECRQTANSTREQKRGIQNEDENCCCVKLLIIFIILLGIIFLLGIFFVFSFVENLITHRKN